MSDKKKSVGRRTVMVRRPNPLAKQKALDTTSEADALTEETLKLANHELEQTKPESYAFQSDPAPVSARSGGFDRSTKHRSVAVARPVKEAWNSSDKRGTFDKDAITKVEPQTLVVGSPTSGAQCDMDGSLLSYTILGQPEDYIQRCPESERQEFEREEVGLTSSLLAMQQRESDQGSVRSFGSAGSQSKRANPPLHGRRGSLARTVRSETKTVRTVKSKGSGTHAPTEASTASYMDESASQRQTRALDLWDKYERERAVLAQHLQEVRGGGGRQPVMFSGDEFREKVEEYELIEKAMPREEKYRDNLWFMSLRDSWARFIPLGSIFSGLFCVVREKSLSEKAFTVVRNPMNQSMVNTKLQKTLAQDGTEHQFHTRAGPESVPKSSWVNMDGIWQKERQLKHNVNELLPFRVDTEGLMIQGSNGIDTALPEPEEEDEVNTAVSGVTARTSKTNKTKKSATVAGGADVSGPGLDLCHPNIAFDSSPDQVATERVTVVNTGTTAMHYKWEKMQKEGKLGLPLRGIDPPGGGFWCCDDSGVLMPGMTTEFPFAFKSHLSGIYTATFRMTTVPEMPEGSEPLVVSMRGVVTEPDERAVKRALLEQHLEHNSVLHGIQEAIIEAIRRVELVPPSAGASEQPPEQARIDAKLFAGANTLTLVKRDVPCMKTQTAYYDPDVLQELNEIAESTKQCAQIGDDVAPKAMSLEEKLTPRPGVYEAGADKQPVEDSWDAVWSWDYALSSLGERQVTILDETERANELAKLDVATEKAIWHAHRPNALYPAAVDAMSELAENIEKMAAQTRRRMGLSAKEFVPPEDEAAADPKGKGKDAKGKGGEEEEPEDDPELVEDFQDVLYAKVRALLCAAVDQFADCAGVVMLEEAERRGEEIE